MTRRGVLALVLLMASGMVATAADPPRKTKPLSFRSPIRQASFGPELAAPEATVVPRIARGGIDAPTLLSPTLANAPVQTPPPPAPIATEAIPVGPVPVGPMPGDPAAEVPIPMEGHSVSLLYPFVRYKDTKNIPACAVPMIVAVPHPCKECCCAYVQICVPPDVCPKIKRKRNGYEVEYDYGSVEVEIKSRDGVITVDYDD